MITVIKVEVECEGCGLIAELELPKKDGNWDHKDVEKALRKARWLLGYDGETFCSRGCQSEYEEED